MFGERKRWGSQGSFGMDSLLLRNLCSPQNIMLTLGIRHIYRNNDRKKECCELVARCWTFGEARRALKYQTSLKKTCQWQRLQLILPQNRWWRLRRFATSTADDDDGNRPDRISGSSPSRRDDSYDFAEESQRGDDNRFNGHKTSLFFVTYAVAW